MSEETFNMDGTEHDIGPDCWCSIGSEDKVHTKCGGYWHYQGVYAGYYYKCDKCHTVSLNPAHANNDVEV
jgi:hypothetical protein